MPLEMADLKPYKSFIVARLPEPHETQSVINAVLEDVKAIIGLGEEIDRIRTELRSHALEPLEGTESIWLGYIHYGEHRAPSWYAGEDELLDETNELFLALQRNRHVVLLLSDDRRKGALQRRLGNGVGNGLGILRHIERGILNAAYVNGPTRTIWLSGVHAPVSVKADSKVLSGQNLRDALDPLDDQTYHFTAARSSVGALRLPVGVAPRSSRIWVGASRRWDEFLGTTVALLRHLERTTNPVAEPLPVVAVEATEAPDPSDAFELQFAAPELLLDSPDIDQETKEMMERWAYHSDFQIVRTEGNTLHCDVTLDDAALGRLALQLDTANPERIRIADVTVEPAEEADPADIAELKKVCGRVAWLKVWFESGHTIANGAIFSIRHRDMPFENHKWINLERYSFSVALDFVGELDAKRIPEALRDQFRAHEHVLSPGTVVEVGQPGRAWTVADRDRKYAIRRENDSLAIMERYSPKKEKFWTGALPQNAEEIIGTDDSLFSWVKNTLANADHPETAIGWLACDDGSMEIADFIHLDDAQQPPVLSMIHAKGAGSDDPTRGISVSSYEVVVGQAVKNLRYLDRMNMAAGLCEGLAKEIGRLIWHNGVISTRERMLEALSGIGSSFRRRVVVLQPHTTLTKITEIREANRQRPPKLHPESGRMRQLDTLLLSAEASCRDLGAEFVVYGEDV